MTRLNSTAGRRRLPVEERVGLIMRAAERIVIRTGHLPIQMDELAAEAGISRAMLYNLFKTPADVINAVVDENIKAMEIEGLSFRAGESLLASCMTASRAYLMLVASRGPALQIILREGYMRRRFSQAVRARKDRVILKLAKLARMELSLSIEQSLAAVCLGVTIPEIAGRMVFEGKLESKAAFELCESLVRSSIISLTPASLKSGDAV